MNAESPRARPERPVEQDWLALRRGVDTAARDTGSVDLLAALHAHWSERGVRRLHVVDLGAGTGANRSYLEPRLSLPRRWTVIDHDPEHLEHPAHTDAERVCAGLADLPALLAARAPEPGTALLVTCAALLDVLSESELQGLARAADEAGADLLLALTVDGEVRFDPAEEGDAVLAAAFDAHQQRGSRPGPEAAGVLAHLLRERGRAVQIAQTPWLLGPDQRPMLRRWLDERVQDALEARPEHAGELRRWQAHRHGQLEAGTLRVRVGHTDLLACAEVSPRERGR